MQTRNLCKRFGGLTVLDNVSFTVEEGERRAIIGPNGAGKTTLFNVLTGLLSPDSGEIYIFDHDVTHLPSYARIPLGLSRTFQITRLLFNLSVLDNVLLAAQALKPFRFNMFRSQSSYSSLLEEAAELLDEWDLLNKKNELVRNLSYGEQRKLEVIMALSSKPKLILLDEPTAGMTKEESGLMDTTIKSLGKDSALVLIEHDMDFVFGLDPDRITVLHYGQIICEGSPQEVKVNPRVREVYLGTTEAGNAPAR